MLIERATVEAAQQKIVPINKKLSRHNENLYCIL